MCIIGIDFDNTIVDYSGVIYDYAVKNRLVPGDIGKDKKVIRDAIRTLPEGEAKWQRAQAIIYGKLMGEASLVDGVRSFLLRCKENGCRTYIVSHKTEFVSMDDENLNLRSSAMCWMEEKGFFKKDGLGVRRDHVFFEGTREGKVGRIRELGCTHFVDDLEELFLERSFPETTQKILYSPAHDVCRDDLNVMRTWSEIGDFIFGNK